MAEEAKARESLVANPANFGKNFERHCMCVMPGQVPCPGYKELPKSMQGQWKYKLRGGEITPEELKEMEMQQEKRLKNL